MQRADRLGAAALLAALAVLASPAHAQPKYRNLTAGGELRPGVYGRIEVHGAPPALIYAAPVTADPMLGAAQGKPVYLYVPPGQVRKWAQNCARWKACRQPVLFVRMDHSPSRLGEWRRLKEHYALQRAD
jgi:hypothetical protein